MVNYKAIADTAEPYGDYQTAFNAMSIETVTQYKELSSNNLREWSTTFQADYTLLKNDDGVLAEMALKQVNIDVSPLDMRKEAVRGFVNALPISLDGKAALLEAATVQVDVWQGLKAGHVQNALQKRAEGKV